MSVTVELVSWTTHHTELRQIREAVFVDEMGIAKDDEWDDLDADAHHFLARDSDRTPLGTARLLPTGQIGRVAVVREHRSAGIGRALLDATVAHAQQLGLRRAFLHAQVQTLSFYRRAGFDIISEEFMEAGIRHREMELLFAIPFNPSPKHRGLKVDNPSPLPSASPERDAQLCRFESDDACAALLCDVVGGARRHVDLFSPELDHRIFDRPDVVDAISAFVRGNRAAQLRILILSTSAILDRGHRLIALMQRLPSKITVRRLDDPRLADPARSYAVADGRAFWLQPDSGSYTGWINHNDPVRVRQLTDAFEEAYAGGREDPELRTLAI